MMFQCKQDKIIPVDCETQLEWLVFIAENSIVLIVDQSAVCMSSRLSRLKSLLSDKFYSAEYNNIERFLLV